MSGRKKGHLQSVKISCFNVYLSHADIFSSESVWCFNLILEIRASISGARLHVTSTKRISRLLIYILKILGRWNAYSVIYLEIWRWWPPIIYITPLVYGEHSNNYFIETRPASDINTVANSILSIGRLCKSNSKENTENLNYHKLMDPTIHCIWDLSHFDYILS